MKIPIVNERDEIIAEKDRKKLNYEKDIYRVSALWIINSEGRSLLAQRAFSKKHHPGKWGPAVAGTVEDEENYRENIIKESEEELGLKNIQPKKIIKEFINGKYKHFTQWYFLILDDGSKLKINREEVVQIKWFNMEEILALIKNNQTTTLSDELLNEIKKMI